MPAVRPFRWSRGERHFSGWYWAATTGRHVGFESWLERDRLVLMDFDPEVAGIASQPFWLHWHDGERERRHAPDYFVRRADGSAVVVDVRADERIGPRDAEAFDVTRLACGQAGWGFERVGCRRRYCWRMSDGFRVTGIPGVCAGGSRTSSGKLSRPRSP
ncbi:TnsA-like heteromeric transposase endonuclease subunit [Streptomyces sp. INA 01156]